MKFRRPRWIRNLGLQLRDTWVLVSQFRVSLIVFALALLVGGSAYYLLGRQAGVAHPASLPEGIYNVLSMIFLQASAEFPDLWYLQIFFFLMPLLGLGILGQGAAEFGVLLFNRQARGETWEMAVAETFSNHIVIVGFGHVGFRIARELHNMDEPFVIIERDPKAALVSQAHDWNVPVLQGDAAQYELLKAAGVERARTIAIVTNNDTANLQIAIHARTLNPKIRSIVRLFDDSFAREVCSAFGITAVFSASALAAPIFAAAAAGLEPAQSVTVNGRVLNLSHLALTPGSPLIGKTIDQAENGNDLSVVMLRRGADAKLNPRNDTVLKPGDQITVFAETATLHKLTGG